MLSIIFGDWTMVAYLALAMVLYGLAYRRWFNWLALLLLVPLALLLAYYLYSALDPVYPELLPQLRQLHLLVRPAIVSILATQAIYFHRDVAARGVGKLHHQLVGLIRLWLSLLRSLSR